MNPVHSTLRPLLNLSALTGFRISFLSEDTPCRNSTYAWIPSRHLKQFLYQFIKHCDIAVQAINQSDCDAFFIFEHKSHYSIVLYIALISTGKPVFFLVHGLQQLHSKSFFHALGFKVLQCLVYNLSFFPVHIEKNDALLPPAFRFKDSKCITIPHPHPVAETVHCSFEAKWNQPRYRVGVVGMFREDKPTRKLIETLLAIHRSECDFDLVVGTPFWQKPSFLDLLGIEIVDTSSESGYYELLANLHVSVQDFSRRDYFFRPSGTINDAAMHHCFVMCPDFPVFSAQINIPVSVGAAFRSHEELPEMLVSTLQMLKSSTPDFSAWKAYRTIRSIAAILRPFMESKINNNSLSSLTSST